MKLTQGEINLYVSDLERAAGFYADALDFEVFESDEGWRRLKNGPMVITMFLAKAPGPAPKTGMQPCMTADMQVDDIEEAHRRLKAAGAEVSEIKDWPGGKHVIFADLDGIGWELLSS